MKTTPMPTDPAAAPLDLAVVGLGCLFPKANGPGAYWANIKNAVDGITDVPDTHWNPADYFDDDPKAPDKTYARRGGFLDPIDFNPLEFGIAPRDLEATDTTQLLGLVAAKQALTDAGVVFDGISPKRVERSRVSVLLGVTGTLELVIPLGARLGHPKWKQAMRDAGIAEDRIADASQRISDSYVPWQENSFPGLLGNVVAGRIANRLDLHGTNCVVDAACASSLSAMHLASMELNAGKADVVVTGGADTFNDIFMYMCFSKTPALSPTGNSRPFDADGDGTILGEGLGIVVLKRLADAEAAGDRIYAVVKSIGTSSDGKGNAIYAPSAEGQKRCLQDAYARAGISPATVELVEAHGTGTKVGDGVEAKALAEVYDAAANGRSRPWCAVGSVKSQIGHTKAAAGAAGLIKAVLALHTKVLPPTMKVTLPVEPLRANDTPFYVNLQMRPWLPNAEHPRRAALSAFGFGGSNFHAVLEEYAPAKVAPDWDGSVEILALHGTPDSILADLAALESDPTWPTLARAAETSRGRFEPNAPARLVIAALRDKTDLAKAYAAARSHIGSNPRSRLLADGIFYAVGKPPGKLAVLFPGQGSQSVGMMRDTACLFPEMLQTLALVDDIVKQDEVFAGRISDVIYPPTSFLSGVQAVRDAALRATDAAQPAIGAVSYGAWRVLSERFGIRAEAFAGHSYGELTALAAAGRLSPSDYFRLSRLRGRLMARQGSQSGGDPGTMLAVFAPYERIEQLVVAEILDVVAANFNTPSQTVLSGSTREIERAAKVFADASIRTMRLTVAAAFHSSFVAEAAKPFREALNGASMPSGTIPVYANTTGKAYPTDESEARALLGHQLAKPVAFVEQIRTMAAAGFGTFVEVGPGSIVSRLTEATLSESNLPGVVLALDSAGRRRGNMDYAFVIGALSALGYPVALEAWEAESGCRPGPVTKPAHTVKLSGANHVTPRPQRPPTVSTTEPRTTPTGPMMAQQPNTDTGLNQALSLTQQTLAALQQLQEQTSQLHRRFLESQAAAQATLFQLVAQQNAALGVSLANTPVSNYARPTPPPTPAPVATAAPAPVVRTVPPVAVPVVRIMPIMPIASVPAYANGVTSTPPAGDRITRILLEVVAEKTGYPASMLDLDNSLDGDLGVDSIKRVEILSALQERLPNAPVVKPEHLGTLHTLRDIADFLAGEVMPPPTSRAAPIRPVSLEPKKSVERSVVDARTLPAAKPSRLSSSDAFAATLSGNSLESVTQILLEVVAEKTGYPASMLDLANSLDSDLGVDSIKRVEILSALQERLPNAPVVKPEHLGTLHTLKDIAVFLSSGSLNTAKIDVSVIRSVPKTSSELTNTVSIDQLALIQSSFDSPSESLAPKTEHVSTIRPHTGLTPVIPPALRPRTTAQQPSIIDEVASALESMRHSALTASTDQVERSTLQVVDLDLASGRQRLPLAVGSEFWLIAQADDALAAEIVVNLSTSGFAVKQYPWLDPETIKPSQGPAAVLFLPPEQSQGTPTNKLAFRWLQFCGPKLRQLARQGATVFVGSITRLDGEFGLGDLSPTADPTQGGLAGILKTARYEWGELNYKAIDINAAHASAQPNTAAGSIVDEIQLAGPIEVGIAARHRCILEPARAMRRLHSGTPLLTPKDVVLVTGGARGVTSDVAIALAETYRCTMILTGRTHLPTGPEPEWIRDLFDETDMKRAITEHLGASATPKSVGEFYAKTAAQRQITRTVSAIEKAGAKTAYYAVNITAGRQIADLIHQVKQKFGPISALVHGAGVLADKRIEDLTVEQFDMVYATKVEGLATILQLLAQQELKAILLFSSTTARFGRIGQLAYAASNEVLNKTAQVEARRRPNSRVVAINWGPWEGGMVTPSLRKVFESEGIGMIPLTEGANFAVQELSATGKAVEVIALGKPNRNRSGAGSSSGSGSLGSSAQIGSLNLSGPAPATSPPSPELSLVVERLVDVESHPVLRSHVMDHKAVVPMAIHMEWLTHAALHNNPGLLFHGMNDLRITNGVQIDDSAAASLRIYAGKAVKNDKFFHVGVELRGKRRDGRDIMHSRAEVILTASLPKPPAFDATPAVKPSDYSLEEVYEHFLFHGPDLQGIERIEGLTDTAFVGSAYPAPPPSNWFQAPLRNSWCADPLVLDSAFQMMILWSFAQHGAGSLPCFAGRYRQYRRAYPTGPVRIVIRVTRDNGMFARADMDFLDAEGLLVAQIQDYECVIDRSLDQAFRRNHLLAAAK